ncbi:hypothetical protein AMEX_G4146 [Astyanax mexicanus]|uniref:Uncharacterized protein n=1 Tax=Astyanax mexicanus TaxID=7994 RepID=A0A8T2MDG5_ASTMX|nr:hypothetical protein AMEX_G4146 [Astyanax mexicanus]
MFFSFADVSLGFRRLEAGGWSGAVKGCSSCLQVTWRMIWSGVASGKHPEQETLRARKPWNQSEENI